MESEFRQPLDSQEGGHGSMSDRPAHHIGDAAEQFVQHLQCDHPSVTGFTGGGHGVLWRCLGEEREEGGNEGE